MVFSFFCIKYHFHQSTGRSIWDFVGAGVAGFCVAVALPEDSVGFAVFPCELPDVVGVFVEFEEGFCVLSLMSKVTSELGSIEGKLVGFEVPSSPVAPVASESLFVPSATLADVAGAAGLFLLSSFFSQEAITIHKATAKHIIINKNAFFFISESKILSKIFFITICTYFHFTTLYYYVSRKFLLHKTTYFLLSLKVLSS
jgi:hypothetical protein